MSSESFMARLNAYMTSHNRGVAVDNAELAQPQEEKNEADSSIDVVSQLDEVQVDDTEIIGKP
jgi:hypothetical protein